MGAAAGWRRECPGDSEACEEAGGVVRRTGDVAAEIVDRPGPHPDVLHPPAHEDRPVETEEGPGAGRGVNFLVDECPHTSLVGVALDRGHEATHVTWRGLAGVQDWNLMAPIREGAFTFVTG